MMSDQDYYNAMRPYEEVVWQTIKNIYKDVFTKKYKAGDIIAHDRYILNPFPKLSPSKIFNSKIKIIGG